MAAPTEFSLSFLMVTSSQHMDFVSADISENKLHVSFLGKILKLSQFRGKTKSSEYYLSRSLRLPQVSGTQVWLTRQSNPRVVEHDSIPKEVGHLHGKQSNFLMES